MIDSLRPNSQGLQSIVQVTEGAGWVQRDGCTRLCRSCEVVRLIALGYGNKEIAARLQVSVKTA